MRGFLRALARPARRGSAVLPALLLVAPPVVTPAGAAEPEALAVPAVVGPAGAAEPAPVAALARGPIVPVAVSTLGRAAPLTLAPAASPSPCLDPDATDYYAFPLVTTRNVPGTALARGTGTVTFAPSPFAVSVAPDGSYHYRVRVSVDRLKAAPRGVYVGWVATSDLGTVERLGVLDPQAGVEGDVAWNKFLVVVTLEPTDDPDQGRWSGPVVMRGMSRSGMMHTMAGHGPFQQENCAAWGFGG